MKILEVNKYFYARRGAERHFLDLIDLLRRHGHEVEVFSMNHKENSYENLNHHFVSYVGYNWDDSTWWQKVKGAGRVFWSFEARRKMRSLIREWRPDVVHLHNIYHQLSPSILGPVKYQKIPMVMTVHDYNLVSPDKDAYYPEVGKKYWRFLFYPKYSLIKRLLLVLKMYWNAFGRFYNCIRAYIVPSEFVKSTLAEAGMDEKKIHVIPHFIPEMKGQEKNILFRHTFPDRPFALYFGSLTPEKGVDTLVNIFDTLQVPLVLIGNSERGYVPPYSKYVAVFSRQPKEEIEEWIKRCAVVVSASELPETFGLIALETIALGKPFFGVRVGAFSEIIENEKNGYLVRDVAELRIQLKRFFHNDLVFNSETIKSDARARFSEEKYLRSIEALFSSL